MYGQYGVDGRSTCKRMPSSCKLLLKFHCLFFIKIRNLIYQELQMRSNISIYMLLLCYCTQMISKYPVLVSRWHKPTQRLTFNILRCDMTI